MLRKDILEAAEKCVCGDRDTQYGSPENSFRLIARLWNDYLFTGKNKGGPVQSDIISSRDVAAMMALLKIARIRGGRKDDNWVDLAGYAACGGELDDTKQKTAG